MMTPEFSQRLLHLIPALMALAAALAAETVNAGSQPGSKHAIELSAPTGAAEMVRIVQAPGRTWRLQLADNAGLFASSTATGRAPSAYGEDRFLAGQIQGVKDSWVRLNWIDGTWSGAVFDGRELYMVDRADRIERSLSPDSTGPSPGADRFDQGLVVYPFSDLDLSSIGLHAPRTVAGTRARADTPADYAQFIEHLREVARANVSLFRLPLTIVTDADFGARFGTGTASIVAGRANFVDGIYTSQLGTGIALFHHEQLSSNASLTAEEAEPLLQEFRTFMVSGSGRDIPFSGLAHLFTARPRDGQTAGIAFLGVLCNPFAGFGLNWNLSSETVSGLLLAHEIGHNFNAPHDGEEACADETFRGIMNPSLTGTRQFSDCSLDQMSASVAGASCLVEVHYDDLMWHNRATGKTEIWHMDGTAVVRIGSPPGIADPDWILTDSADFDGDGRNDFFWRAENRGAGQNRIWLIDGDRRTAGSNIASIGSDWTLGGAGDFNGDGRDDLLWRQTRPVTGQNRVWLMNGLARLQGDSINLLRGAEWQVGGVGDFNGDGRDDILWRSSLRPQTRIWLMDGPDRGGSTALPLIDNAWTVAGTGDFDGDGRADILWRHQTLGQNRIWLMDGLSIKARGAINLIRPVSWQVAGTGDLDGDGRDDIVWRDDTSGQNRVWLMNGLTRRQGAAIATQADPDWRIIGVGNTD